MKPITIHPASVVFGIALACAGLFMISAQTHIVQGTIELPPRVQVSQIAGIPDPNDMVVIRGEDGPYIVPAGKVFALTGLGSLSIEGCGLSLNGVPILSRLPNGASPTEPFSTITEVPPGLAARPGDVIDIGPLNARAFGYLIDAR